MREGIDVSSYQGTIDWDKARASGKVEFAILKVIRKDLNPDKQFENNWKGCLNANVKILGVYNYSYATTKMKAVSDAKRVLVILNGRKAKVYLDVEDACLKGLGKLLIEIIDAYAEVILGAGLEFGVYTGQSFYNSYIKPYGGVKYPLWIARYGKNDGTMDLQYQPHIEGMEGWQYTSRGSVPGIQDNVDMNVFYDVAEVRKGRPTLRKGDKGEDVVYLQQRLEYHDIDPKGVDGSFGANTKIAVKEFQKKYKLKVDGVVGPLTWAKLESDDKVESSVKEFSLAKDGDEKISLNFRVREFRCKDGSDKILIDVDFVQNVLQKIRDHFGTSVKINSAYRTPSHNKAVGGANGSYHVKGQAFDIVVSGQSPATVAKYAQSIGCKGIIQYDTFVHVDSRTKKYFAVNK